MTPRFTRRDAATTLGVGAVAAFAVSMGAAVLPTVEVAAIVVLLQLTLVLLRERPSGTPRRPRSAPPDALDRARVTVEGALADPLGVDGALTQAVRTVVRARLAAAGRAPAEVVDELPAPLASVLRGRWEHDRGMTPAELDEVLTAMEVFDP